MLIERRAIYQIQTELTIISQKCDFQRNWTSFCVQFFAKNEGKIPHIPYSYKDFSLGLLYYIIRNYDSSINREYFRYSVISKTGKRQKHVFKIYRELCDEFGKPSQEIDYRTLWNNISDYLTKTYHYELDSDMFEWLIKSFPSKKFSQIRGLKTLFYRAQKHPRKYLQKQLEYFILNSFSEMNLL